MEMRQNQKVFKTGMLVRKACAALMNIFLAKYLSNWNSFLSVPV